LILPTFYKQLLLEHIPKRKKTDSLTVFFALLGSAAAKALRKMLVKLTPGPGSKSPTFYEQLFCAKFPKAQKDTDD